MTGMPIASSSLPVVLRVGDGFFAQITDLAGRFGVTVVEGAQTQSIPGSFWGESEAGLIGNTLHLRGDTPVHSVLHELGHFVCMDQKRRSGLHTNAGGDALEECAVCYLEILLADCLEGVGRDRLMRDMDAWGYSFRLGSTRRWFSEDAQNAQEWLEEEGLISKGEPTFRVRK